MSRKCWQGGDINYLVDLDTENDFVVSELNSWIKSLVDTYSIDGFRIDTVKHIRSEFWTGFNDAAGVYCVGEVANGDAAYACPYTEVLDGILNYPLFYSITKAFGTREEGAMKGLADNLNYINSLCKDTTSMAPFLENHDQPRVRLLQAQNFILLIKAFTWQFPSVTPDLILARNAIAFTMLSDGLPVIYQGQENHFSGANDPEDREAVWTKGYATSGESAPLYEHITLLNKIRTHAISADSSSISSISTSIYNDDKTIATKKSGLVGVFSNVGQDGSGGEVEIEDTGYAEGDEVIDLVGCTTLNAGTAGSLSLDMSGGDVKVSVVISTDWVGY